VGYKP